MLRGHYTCGSRYSTSNWRNLAIRLNNIGMIVLGLALLWRLACPIEPLMIAMTVCFHRF